jgi:transposase
VLFSMMAWNEAGYSGLTAQESKHGTFCRAGHIGCRDECLHVDDHGKIARERKVPTEPEAIIEALNGSGQVYASGSVWKPDRCHSGYTVNWRKLACRSSASRRGTFVRCSRRQVNKTDRNDARGIAQIIRVGLFRPVHVKTLQSQQRRMLLRTRKLLQSKMLDLENDLRGTLKNFGFKDSEDRCRQFRG